MDIFASETHLYITIDKCFMLVINFEKKYICSGKYEYVKINDAIKTCDLYSILFDKTKYKIIKELLDSTNDIRESCIECNYFERCSEPTYHYKEANRILKEFKKFIENI